MTILRICAGLVALMWASLPVQAQTMPPAQMRLIEGRFADKPLVAVELIVPQGFKTYWRSPGDSGVAPQFDWTGSTNLKSAEVHYPAPVRFPDAYGDTLGYHAGVLILPLQLSAADPAQPVILKLALDYGLCSNICIPMHGEAELTLGRSPSREAASVIMGAQQRVPQKAASGAALRQWSVRGEGPFMIEMSAALDGGVEHIAVEGPENWRIGLPQPIKDRPGMFSLALENLPKDADPATPLRITLIGPKAAIEETRTLR